MFRPLRTVVIASSLLAVSICVRYTIFVIWFAEYKDRMVGPSISYALHAMLAITGAQVVNLVCWWIVRKKFVERRFLWHVALGTLACAVVCFLLAERLRYSGDPAAPGRQTRTTHDARAAPSTWTI